MNKQQRLAECKRRQGLAHAEAERQEKILERYLNSTKLKKLQRNVRNANDKLNLIIEEWNDIIMEDHRTNCGLDEGYGVENPVSVNGELRYGYKDDPKSW